MWYVRFSENEVRRGTLQQLQALIANGRLSPATLVRASADSPWVQAGTVDELFPGLEALEPLQPTSSEIAATAPPAARHPVLVYAAIATAVVLILVVVGTVVALRGRGQTGIANASPARPAGTSASAAAAGQVTSATTNPATVPLSRAVVEVGGANILSEARTVPYRYLGQAEIFDGKMRTHGNKPDIAFFNTALPSEYTIDITACPKTRPESLHVGLVVDGRQTVFIIDAFMGTRSGLFSIEGRNMNDPNYPGVYEGRLLTLDQTAKIKICVTPDSVAAWVDNKPIFRWEGDPKTLNWNLPYAAPTRPCLMLGSWDCRYEITNWAISKGVVELPSLGLLASADPRKTQRQRQASQPTGAPNGRRAEMRLTELVDLVEPSVARLDVFSPLGKGVGSGFVIADGVLVTNHHVVAGAKAVRITFSNKHTLDATAMVALDRMRDLAIICFDSQKHFAAPLPFAKDLPGVGEEVAAFGAPQGLSFTTSNGIVSSLRHSRDLQEYGVNLSCNMVQTSAPISPGNSGGPLVDMYGQVVGVNTLQLRTGQNLNFAVSSKDVENLYNNSRVAIQNKLYVGNYMKTEEMPSPEKLYTAQRAALALPKPTQLDWVINGRTAKATLVSVQTAEEKPRTPRQFRVDELVAGKYQPPAALKVRLKGANGNAAEFDLAALDSAGVERVRERWLAEAHHIIEEHLLQGGNQMMQILLTQSRGNGLPGFAAEAISSIFMVADSVLPEPRAQLVRAQILQNLQFAGIETPEDHIRQALVKVEAELKTQWSKDNQLNERITQILQRMLVSSEET